MRGTGEHPAAARHELPDFCLVLLFGDPCRCDLQVFAAAVFAVGALVETAAVAAQLGRRQLAAVDVTHATRDELKRLSRCAVDAYARVNAIAVGTDGGLVARRLGTIAHEALLQVDPSSPGLIALRPLSTDRRGEAGPFDIIGDVHGCLDELLDLLASLGYRCDRSGLRITPPAGRRVIFWDPPCNCRLTVSGLSSIST